MGKDEIIYQVELEKLPHYMEKNKTGLLPNTIYKGELQKS